MDHEALDRARARLAEARNGHDDGAAVAAALAGAKDGLEALAETTAGLQADIPERLTAALAESLRSEVVPVARSLAEVRGTSSAIVRRLERMQVELVAERKARVEDLALLVDLIASGWRGVERRLDRLERSLDRLERALEDGPAAPVYQFGERQERQQPGA